MSQELKPCPFCKSTAHRGKTYKTEDYAFCDGCGATEKIPVWQARPPNQTAEEVIEKFREEFTNPYPENMFLPMSEEDLKKVHETLKEHLGIPIDKLTGHIGRHTWKWLTGDFISFLRENMPVAGLDVEAIRQIIGIHNSKHSNDINYDPGMEASKEIAARFAPRKVVWPEKREPYKFKVGGQVADKYATKFYNEAIELCIKAAEEGGSIGT